ncbi:Folliculin-interacting protein 1 [Chamberlinius hualienensis]
MALLNKFFNNRKRTVKTTGNTEPDFLNSSRWKCPNFNKSRIRVLVFRDCEWRGRKLLFDLDSINKIDLNNQSSDVHGDASKSSPQNGMGCKNNCDKRSSSGYIEVTPNGIGYQYLRPRSDVKMLGEMIFGSVAMSYKGVAIKIHSIRSSSQLMFSKVFSAPAASRTKNRDSFGNSLQNSLTESIPKSSSASGICDAIAHSVPVDVPIHANASALHSDDDLEWLTTSSLRSNGTYDGSKSVHQRSPDGSCASFGSLTRSGSYNSLHRRWLRTQNTSMEFGIKRKSDENVNCNEKQMPNNSRAKLGVSVVVTLGSSTEEEKHLQTFFFSHIALIESYVNKLSMAVENAYINKRQFVHSLMEASTSFQQSLYDLYTAPRFPEPVWLSMMTHGNLQQPICSRFMKELRGLLEQNDCKTTNFFMSTLLTAVLTHHLAWVPTVTPPDILPTQSFYQKHTAKWLDMLAKLHPYNPLWVQLGDLYGALGNPCKIARTVIVGRNADLVRRILYCLTYFIRCCEVSENVEQRCLFAPRSRLFSTSSTSSGGTLVGEQGRSLPSTPILSANDEAVKSNNSNKHFSTLFSNLINLQKSEPDGKLVERQVGEGDDDDDEVFLKEMKEKLRQKSSCKSCSAVCRCRRNNRNGAIYTNGINIDENKTSLVRVGTGQGQLCDIPAVLGNEHDSGVDFPIDTDDGASFRTVLNRDGCHNKSKRKGTNGKVSFSIGSIPLEEICSPLQQEDDSNQSLVCTCGKHLPGIANKENLSENLRLKSLNESKKAAMYNHNVKILQTNIELDSNLINSDSALTADVDDRFSSNRCDSGIHSCDASIADLHESVRCVNVTNSVEALQISIPPIKVEHIRNVGKSVDTRTGESEFQIRPKIKATDFKRTFNYERTNSIFDEYFDESIELKSLDEETFQQKLKVMREQRSNKNGDYSLKCDSSNDPFIGNDGLTEEQEIVSQNGESNSTVDNTEMSSKMRRICWNSQLSSSLEGSDFFDRVLELPLPNSEVIQTAITNNDHSRGFGWSLTANFTDHYMSDFALQGTNQTDFGQQLLSDLKMAVRSPVLDETVTEAVAVVANTDDWTVQVVSSKYGSVSEDGSPVGTRVMMSQLVAGITDSLLQLWHLKMSPDFCLMHLEDRLQELYFKGRLLSEYSATSTTSLDLKSLIHAMGVDTSDLPLLLSIASIHSSQDMGGVIACT